MALSAQQIERYSRQIVLPEIGGRGQQTLLGTAVALTGGGVLTPWVARYLAAAGIGRLDILRADDAGAAPALGADLADLNPDGVYRTVAEPASGADVAWTAYDVLVATDAARLALFNAAAVQVPRPLVVGAAGGASGWLAVLDPTGSDQPCAACETLPAPDQPSGAFSPLAAAAAGVIGSQMAVEVVRLRLDGRARRAATLLQYDTRTAAVVRRSLARNPSCRVCGSA